MITEYKTILCNHWLQSMSMNEQILRFSITELRKLKSILTLLESGLQIFPEMEEYFTKWN